MANTAQRDVLLLGTQNANGTITGVSAAQSSQAINLKDYPLASIYIEADGGTISGGTIIIEQALWNPLVGHGPYTGLWSQLQSITASTLTGTAQQQAFNIGAIASGFCRVRLSSPITGGGLIIARLTAVGDS